MSAAAASAPPRPVQLRLFDDEPGPPAPPPPPPPPATASNADIGALLDRIAELLEARGHEPFRARAYRAAAARVRASRRPIVDVLRRRGRPGLVRMRGIGEGIAAVIDEYVTTGESGVLTRLREDVTPVDRLRAVPGVGPALAARIHARLGIESLEELEVAAHDGRLARLEGFGARRLAAVRAALAGILGRQSRARARGLAAADDAGPRPPAKRPPVALLLEVDADYRRRAAAGELRLIAPRRFNPGHRAWLPIMHARRDGFRFTALYSNTPRAHQLDRTHDWVVIYHEPERGGGPEGRATVVTERRGRFRGHRIVRGREAECDRLRDRERADAAG